jgi:CBS domain-containing protein
VAEVASFGAALFFLGAWRLGRIFVVEAIEVVGAILGGLFFGFLAEGLLLQTTILAAKMFVFLFQDRNPFEGASVHAFPIADLLPKVEVLPAQRGNFVAKLRYFRTQFANARHPVAAVQFRSAFFKQKAIHDLPTLPLG